MPDAEKTYGAARRDSEIWRIFATEEKKMQEMEAEKDKRMRSEQDMAWEVIASETIISRPWLTAKRSRVRLPDGRVNDEYYVLSYPTWINVIAETTDDRLILERQYRHGIRRVSTEICAGVAEAGESPLEAARRKLAEETGFTGGTWQELMVIAPNPGSMDNFCHCFWAKGVERTGRSPLG